MTDQTPSERRIGDRYRVLETLESSPYELWHQAVSDWGQSVLINEFRAPHQGTLTGNRIRQTFSRNARLLAQAQHPNLIRIQDMIDEPEQQFVVFESPPQTTLRELLQRQAIRPDYTIRAKLYAKQNLTIQTAFTATDSAL